MRRFAGWWLAAGLGWLVAYPLLITVLAALGSREGWTLQHFSEFLGRSDEWLALWRSLWISGASVVFAGLVGVPLALLFSWGDFPGRKTLGALVALPVALPPLVGVLAFLFLWGESGFVARAVRAVFGGEGPPWRLGGPVAILLVHTYSFYVLFYLWTRAALARLDPSLLEAAASLGAGPVQRFRRVTLPLLRPALGAASLLTFMTSLASFTAPYLFGGSFRVMTTRIVASKLNGQLALAQVETVVLAAVALAGLVLLRRVEGRGALAAVGRGLAPVRPRITSPGARRWQGVIGWSTTVFLLLPHLTLLLLSLVPTGSWTTEGWPPVLDSSNYRALFSELERLQPVLSSLWMAASATLLASVVGLAAARRALSGGRSGVLVDSLMALPWALPGTVFALALATTFAVHAPLAGRFVLVGTPVLLPLAYLVRSLPLTGRAARTGLRQLDPALEEAAASLGASRWRIFYRVVLPRIRPALAAGAGLAFITSFGDFVSSIVLYTLDTRPISIEILSSLRVQETGIAAALGVLLMAVGAGVFLLWGREESG